MDKIEKDYALERAKEVEHSQDTEEVNRVFQLMRHDDLRLAEQNFMVIVKVLKQGAQGFENKGMTFIDINKPLQLDKIAEKAGIELSQNDLHHVIFIEPSGNDIIVKGKNNKPLPEQELWEMGILTSTNHCNVRVYGLNLEVLMNPEARFGTCLNNPAILQGLTFNIVEVPKEVVA